MAWNTNFPCATFTTEFTFKREDVEAVGKTRINFNRAYRDGKPRLYTACGLLMHSSLAVTTEGLPLSITAIKFSSRKKFKGANARKKKDKSDAGTD